ncbi:HET domain-containing protein [Colletotrichum fioriniae PJ7]|uniref:HET domain-containing protein n=1 Tax=Colletotrichum fioriniae PJ7 TaxID=1445577 RepID=A0A010S779_9PEZI|nr:HET domain-containing protein [Colletotrichum fioriniae PJ7]
MRLINVNTLLLEEFMGGKAPPSSQRQSTRWINWYQESAVCFAYLEDLDFEATTLPESSGDVVVCRTKSVRFKTQGQQQRCRLEVARSRWLTRGWTLQELLASRRSSLIRISDDQTIFGWTWDHTIPHDWSSLLAPSPAVFKGGDRFFCGSETDESIVGWSMATSCSMTNVGLRIRLPTLKMSGLDLAVLNVSERRSEAGEEEDPSTGRVCIPLLTSNYVGTSDGVSSLIDGSAIGAQGWREPARPIALYELRNIYPSCLQEFRIHPLQRNAELLKYAISLWHVGKPGYRASQMIMPTIETRKAPQSHIEVSSTD